MIKDVESIQIVDGIDELRGAVKDEIPPRERDPEKVYQHRPGQGRPPLPARSVLEGSSTFCARDASGKRSQRSTGAGARSTGDFRNGKEPDPLNGSGPRDWSDTMNWKEPDGSGRAWTAVWSKRRWLRSL